MCSWEQEPSLVEGIFASADELGSLFNLAAGSITAKHFELVNVDLHSGFLRSVFLPRLLLELPFDEEWRTLPSFQYFSRPASCQTGLTFGSIRRVQLLYIKYIVYHAFYNL